MPKRTDEEQERVKIKEIDLEFLPQTVQNKIQTIFNNYLGLGIVKHSMADGYREEIPVFPNKISSLSSPDLGDLQSNYSAWYGYAADKLKYLKVAKNVVEIEADKIVDSVLGSMPLTEKGNIELKKSKAKNDPEYVAVLEYKQIIDGMVTMVESDVQRLDKQLASISREISRRESSGGF